MCGRVRDSDPLGLALTKIFVNRIPYSIITAEYSAAMDIPSETKLEFTLKEPLVIERPGGNVKTKISKSNDS
jgi:hypothetical protein